MFGSTSVLKGIYFVKDEERVRIFWESPESWTPAAGWVWNSVVTVTGQPREMR